MKFLGRLTDFILFVFFTIITIGIYPLYFIVTRTEKCADLLEEIRDILTKPQEKI